jgi:outer membrane protein OmpA-like peptidoglycan-associated protein
MTKKELQALKKELANLRKKMEEYEAMLLEGGAMEDIDAADVTTIYNSLMGAEAVVDGEGPIKKELEWWVDFSLETFVTVKNVKTKKEVTHEFDKEEQMEISLKAGINYEIHIWTKAYIDYYYSIIANKKIEFITKKIYYQISISPDGELGIEKISEKVSEASSPDVLEKFSVEIGSEPKESAHLIVIKGSATTPERDEDGVKYEKQILSETETNIHFNVTDIKEEPKIYITKEILFEKENQKEISNEQFVVLEKWWSSLNKKIVEEIKNNNLEVIIKGYATHTGENKDNAILGKNRAKNVKKFLDSMIGEGLNKIIIEAVGERKNSKRYAEIIIKSR